MSAASNLWRRTHALLAAAVLLAYWGSAMALGESYPLSQLMMFSVPEQAASRVIVRTHDGNYSEVADFDSWQCAPDLNLTGDCSPGFSPQDELAMEIIRQRPNRATDSEEGKGGESVTLVRRVFRVQPDTRGLATEECDIAKCLARRMTP